MNEEKTAMQMLINDMEKRYKGLQDSNSPYRHNTRGVLTILIHEAKSLLQKEQEQIEKAFGDGKASNFKISGITSDKYYQSKYGGEDA